jgi:hypothetical protein
VSLFEPFEVKPKTVAVPFEYLDSVAVSITERKERASEQVRLKLCSMTAARPFMDFLISVRPHARYTRLSNVYAYKFIVSPLADIF